MKKIYNVEKTFENMRIDRWIKKNLEKLPQSFIEKNLRNGKIKIDSKKVKSSYKIKANEKIELYDLFFEVFKKQKKNKFNPSKSVIKSNEDLIIDDNENFLVVNKKSGISVQGGTKSKKNLIDIFAKSKFFLNTKPYSVHRLDKDTSGVFIIAKNRETAQLFTSLFRLRKVHKIYLAICHGEIRSKAGLWDSNLLRYENNKPIIEKAKTYFRVLDKNSNCSLIEMRPITGRKHQLRKQLFDIGHPIYGDQKYNFNNTSKGINKNLMLHSYQIKFMIKDKKFTYTALLPDYFNKFIKIKRLNFVSS